MKRKGWFIPILIFFISISGLVFYQKRQDAHSYAAQANLPPILWSESPADINQVIFSEYGHEVQALRSSRDWELSKPISSKADNLFIYNIILSFKEPSFDTVIDIDPVNLRDYGIDELSPTLKLYTKDNESYELIRGNFADALHYYVYSPMSNTIYTMQKSAFENIHSDLTMWRDKDLLAFNKKDIQNIELTYNNVLHTITPTRLADSVSFKSETLDEKTLNHLVDFLESCTIKDFITDTADSSLLNAYGFSTPDLKVKIALKSGQSLVTVIGKSLKEENLCYVVINHSSSIATIPYFDLSQLLKPESLEKLSSESLTTK
ncbi:MAG: hypothetical protein K0S71_2909 [Clostridia bacterium]|jgi:hypothetical protein|nr:hypothetical protein [Clostridia bacterium]